MHIYIVSFRNNHGMIMYLCCIYMCLQLSPPIWRWFTTEGQEQEDAYDAAIEQLLVLEKELALAGEKEGFVDLSLGPLRHT